jgi:4-nitrophenyl phosphatase
MGQSPFHTPVSKQIAAIVLAAGGSARFGQPKQLVDWGGRTLLAHVCSVALDAGLAPVVAVVGCQAERVRAAVAALPVQTPMNWRWEQGLSTSVQTGLAALFPETEAAILMQCDQPLVSAGLLQAMAARFYESGAPIVHPVYANRRGTPTLFARSLFSEMAAVSGDEGGRGIIARHSEEVAVVEVASPDVLADVDTPADYERLCKSCDRHPQSVSRPPSAVLDPITHLIIDMDGVLWRGEKPVRGLREFFAFLRRRDIGFVLATNNSSRTPEQYTAKLARFGVEVPIECILTSSQVAAAYLAGKAPPGARIYAIGEEGLEQALKQRGFVLADEEVAHVVVGWDRKLTWDKLATAALLIHEGAGFVGTNPDSNYPIERGPVPGNGAQLAALETTTGVAPAVTGKPERWMYEEALKRMGARPETTAVIGDRLDTDLAGGVRTGLTTVLVLSGIATEADLPASPVKPDLVCADIKELTETWD